MEVSYTNQFKKDFKKVCSMGYKKELLKSVVEIIAKHENETGIAQDETLIKQYKNHKLSGNYYGRWELHIKSNWLLIYKIDGNNVIFERTGTHAQIFD